MRIDWLGNRGFRELRTSAGAHAMVEAQGRRTLSAALAGAGRSQFGMKSTSGHTRAGAIVFTENPAAMVRNAKHNTLVRALHGG